ncbi:hypothetical protein RJ55_04833 [Drechmeria coniospora]|nr:hypothetical protein RJ55_04833 [Drechmeria coniospora]
MANALFAASHPGAALLGVSVTFVVALLGWCILSYVSSPLRKYPGPWLAGWTNLWRFALVVRKQYPWTIKRLHETYGPVVRIGPNTLDLDLPELAKTIYGTDGKWVKTRFYNVNSALVDGRIVYNIFSTTDRAEHARMKRPVAKFYSPGAVLAMEPLVDAVLSDLCRHLEARFIDNGNGDKECDLGSWIAYCAWDVVSATTFSEDFQYMAEGLSLIGQIPWLDSLLDKNPVVRLGPPNLANATAIAVEHIARRTQGRDANYDPEVPDYLQHYLEAQRERPEAVRDEFVIQYVLVNLVAGADTTANTIRAILYFALRNRPVWERLCAEVRKAPWEGKVAPYNVAKGLPYLDAVVRESIRLHPGVSMLLERRVPPSGLVLPDGSFVPPGTEVGINPYVAGRNKSVYGDDADEFRPERWLPSDGETATSPSYEARLKRFNAADVAFGGGSHICMGRHFAFVEVYKMVATLLRHYDIALADPTKEWWVAGVWFPRQRGIICRLRRRGSAE